MTVGLRTTAAAVVAAGFLLAPTLADAQGRRAVPRPVLRSRPAVRVGVYYGPSVYYRPWYASRYYWYDPFYYPSPYYYGGWYQPYYYGGGYYGGGYYDISGSMRLHVNPRQTEVFVDGYFAGTVDDFDGVFQRLRLEPGEHDLELFLAGHRSYQQKVYLQPGRTFNVRHSMEPLGPGDAEPARPNGGNRPVTRSRRSEGLPPRDPRDRDADRDRDRDRAPDRDRDPGRAAARSEFGSLALRVQPNDASVTIDGEAWENPGDNERLIVQLGAGVHTVQIRKDGYRTYMTDVTIRSGETATLNVAMTPNR